MTIASMEKRNPGTSSYSSNIGAVPRNIGQTMVVSPPTTTPASAVHPLPVQGQDHCRAECSAESRPGHQLQHPAFRIARQPLRSQCDTEQRMTAM